MNPKADNITTFRPVLLALYTSEAHQSPLFSMLIPNSPRCLYKIDMTSWARQEGRLPTISTRIISNEITGEPNIKSSCRLQKLNLLIRKPNRQRPDIVMQMLNLAASNKREHIRRLAEHIGQRNSSNRLNPMLSSNNGQCLGDMLLLFRLLTTHRTTQTLACLLSLLELFSSLEMPTAKHIPRRKRHPEMPRHGDDIALKVAAHHVPSALVDGERCFAVRARIRVRRGNDPRRRIRNPEVHDLALLDEDMEGVHDFLDGGSVVPPVEVEDIDEVSLEFAEGVANADDHVALVVAAGVGGVALPERVAAVVSCELGG